MRFQDVLDSGFGKLERKKETHNTKRERERERERERMKKRGVMILKNWRSERWGYDLENWK